MYEYTNKDDIKVKLIKLNRQANSKYREIAQKILQIISTKSDQKLDRNMPIINHGNTGNLISTYIHI